MFIDILSRKFVPDKMIWEFKRNTACISRQIRICFYPCLFSAFGDDDHGFAQDAVINHIAGLEFGNDCSRRFFFVLLSS